MNRKKFLKIAGIATGGIIILPPTLYLVSPEIKKFAVNVIYQELSYLKLDAEGVNNFVEDYFKNFNDNLGFKIRWKIYYYLKIKADKSDNLFQLVRSYLLSSDFFINRMNMVEPVKYLGLFNPYTSPMANPYSYFYHL
jgi:hypothetical protein